MPASVEVTISPVTGKFDPEDQRWRDQVAALHAMLSEEAGAVSLRRVARRGAKGALDSAILALGSSGALTAAVACFRAWLKRDKTRTLTVTWTDEAGAEHRATVTGDNLDETSFQALVQAIGRRLEGG
jgi:hypothetical protein